MLTNEIKSWILNIRKSHVGKDKTSGGLRKLKGGNGRYES